MKKTKISHWNYRVFENDNINNKEYGIIEVYYDLRNNPIAYTDYQIPWGSTLKELKKEISSMLKACRYEILKKEDFKKKRKKKNA